MTAELVVAAFGDLMLGDSPTSPGYGFRTRYSGDSASWALQRLASLNAGADIVLGNLEVVLSEHGEGAGLIDRDCMRGDREYAGLLAQLGFNVIAVANNHAMQHGDLGFAQTVDTLRSAKIDVAGLRGEGGWCCEPVFRTSNVGARAGVLAYSFRPRQYGVGVPPYATGTEEQVIGDVQRLAPLVDYVVVSLHWGEEFVDLPSLEEAVFAERLVRAGARVIVGHHPHVIRPIDFDGQSCIAYSLGNACSDMVFLPEFRTGLVLRTRLRGSAMHIERRTIETSGDYRVTANEDWMPVSLGRCEPLASEAYQIAIRRSMARYRRALVTHILRNAGRTPPGILMDLFLRKTRNLLLRFTSRPSRSAR